MMHSRFLGYLQLNLGTGVVGSDRHINKSTALQTCLLTTCTLHEQAVLSLLLFSCMLCLPLLETSNKTRKVKTLSILAAVQVLCSARSLPQCRH